MLLDDSDGFWDALNFEELEDPQESEQLLAKLHAFYTKGLFAYGTLRHSSSITCWDEGQQQIVERDGGKDVKDEHVVDIVRLNLVDIGLDIGFTSLIDNECQPRPQKDIDTKAEAEDAKIGVRNARKDANNDIKKEEKDGTAEDICKKAEEDVHKLTDSFIKKIDELLAVKEAEIMKV